ncbi:hypothetical protein [Georgenia faecalis]|uniref:DUF998 domain-containing protein n=1 Tax=Georgenia faecalis TaxID=2483799 RepID=A0ABV9D997_9MICO|nr:hypothetical protein [Georgenia faecalis]
MTVSAQATVTHAAPSRSRPARGFVVGAVAAVVGLLPWLVSGMRLPLQNLWATEGIPDQMPLVLLPFSQYQVTTIPALIVTGAALAGIAVRAGRLSLAAALAGVLVVQGAAVVQTALAVDAGLEDRTESTLYLAGLVAVAVASVLVGVVVLLLVARAPRAGALLGLGVAALLLQSWLGALVVPSGTVPGDNAMTLLGALRWVAPVLIGAAVAWAGVRTPGRAVAACAVLLGLWLVPALLTAVSSAVGSRVLARDLPGMLEYGVQVFRAAVTMPDLVVPPLVVAVAVAAVGLAARGLLSRTRGRAGAPR